MVHGKHLIGLALVVAVAAAGGAAWATAAQHPGGGDLPPEAATNAVVAGPENGTFVRMTPCRLVDTRIGGGKLADREIRRYKVATSGIWFEQQGGRPGGCGIPANATAAEVTVTAVSADGTGFVRVFPRTVGDGTFMNYTNVFNVSNTGTVALCGGTAEGCLETEDLGVRTYGSSTHLVIDVQGYYEKPMTVAVSPTGEVLRASSVVGVTKLPGVGEYSVDFGRSIADCTMVASLGAANGGASIGQVRAQMNAIDDEAAFVATHDSAGADADKAFMLQVIC